MIRAQPNFTYVAIENDSCKVIYLNKSSNTFQEVQQLFPDKNIVLEVFLKGSTCMLTVTDDTKTRFASFTKLASTKFNFKTLRVTPSKCPLDQLNMAMVRDDILKM
jgi:hypothetical protein